VNAVHAPCTGDSDRAAHQGRQLPRNGKAEAGAAVFSRRRRVMLTISLARDISAKTNIGLDRPRARCPVNTAGRGGDLVFTIGRRI
jgi:hypothetical protein